MRLDKFLKISRIIKRRTIAKTVVDGGKAKLNNKLAKAGSQVKEKDILEIEYYDKFFKFEIQEVPSGSIKKEKSKELVTLLDFKILKKIDEEII